MYHRLFNAFDGFKGLLDDVFAGLCQHLDGHVIRNQVLLDQCPAEFVFGLGSGREAHLDLLESNLYQ